MWSGGRGAIQVGAALLLLTAGIARADSIEQYTSSTPYTDLFNYSSVGDLEMETLAFPAFDPTLGTLTGVSFTFTGSTGTNDDTTSTADGDPSQFYIDNSGQSVSTTYDQSLSLQFYLVDDNGSANQSCVMNLVENYTLNPGDEANASCTVGSLTGSSLMFSDTQTVSAGNTFTDPVNLVASTVVSDSNLSEFVSSAGGDLLFPVFLERNDMIQLDNGNGIDDLYVAASVTATVTYTYSLNGGSQQAPSVPEPSSLVLIGGLLAGLALIRVSRFVNGIR